MSHTQRGNSADHDTIALLRSQLHAAQSSQKKTVEELELAKLDAEERAQSLTELRRTVQLLDNEKSSVSTCVLITCLSSRPCQQLEIANETQLSELSDAREVISELRRALDLKTMDSDRASLVSTSSIKQEGSATKEEIKGLEDYIHFYYKGLLSRDNGLLTKLLSCQTL